MNRLPGDQEAAVYVVDDHLPQREALSDLFKSVGLPAELFSSANDFLEADLPDLPSCLVLDVRLPGLSGLEFQAHLNQTGDHTPIIFITGFPDVRLSVHAIKRGAVDFLAKPVRDQDLLDAVHRAIAFDRARRASQAARISLLDLYSALTEREREVMDFVSAGLLNKQIAGRLGLSDVTVKIHRARVMRKMRARSVPDLVRMSDQIKSDNK